MLYPLKLTAPLKDYLWGGMRLKEEYNKQTNLEKVAESWELSCHKDGQSVIQNGPEAGKSLDQYLDEQGDIVLGKNAEKFPYFPLLIKLIDAKDNLSVQVHPDNEYAMRVEGEFGKTEMWYIVDCEPGASLLYGFKQEITKSEFARRIENDTILEVCNRVPVKKGDVFFIDSGTLHAIGKGILLCEVQQNSNTTYRIYDYGRVGKDGKPRELHVEKAKDVTKLAPAEQYPDTPVEQHEGYTSKLMASCEYFTTYVLDIDGKAHLTADATSFNSLLVLEGEGTVTADSELAVQHSENGGKVSENGLPEGTIKLYKGNSVFITAGTGGYTIEGKAKLVLTKV